MAEVFKVNWSCQ